MVSFDPRPEEGIAVALTQFKIQYRDGNTQEVTAVRPLRDGDWLVFADGSSEVLRVPGAEVESVRRDDVEDRTRHAPTTGAV
jgi:hypothetical protein